MQRFTTPVLLAAVATTAVLAAGCTTTVSGAAAPAAASAPLSSPAAPAGDAVAWVNRVCGALTPLDKLTTAEPDIDPNEPGAAVKALSSLFGTAITAMDSAVSGLKAAGPSPVKGGDDLVNKVSSTVTSVRGKVADAKSKIDQIDPADPQQLASTLPDVLGPLTELTNLPSPTADLAANAELEKAAKQAPNCTALKAIGG
ncbi:hypothetical protein [Pseudonocardia sp. GCM10023141]|uniref:hypothetical protein n=1 Tax=Pseudonocardia sp. GCM10023141 TaxID=3252653 RepID=UPI00362275A3